MDARFADVVATEARLRALVGEPKPAVRDAWIDRLDAHCRALIARSPFVLVASADRAGHVEVSPKGDPAGFVQVLDERTLAIPERPGNRRALTFSNVLQNAKVGLLFVVPGKAETLRVNGRAAIVHDRWLRERMAVAGKLPDLALVVDVAEAFVHCTKCMVRSKLWDRAHWPPSDGLPTLARAVVDHAGLSRSVEEVQAAIDEDVRERLY